MKSSTGRQQCRARDRRRSVCGPPCFFGKSATVEPSACVGTTEVRLDSVAENVALQQAVRVHTFGEVHAVYSSSDMGISLTGSNPLTGDTRSMRASTSRQTILFGDVAVFCQWLFRTHTSVQDLQESLHDAAKNALPLSTRTDSYQKLPAIKKKCMTCSLDCMQLNANRPA